MAKSQQRQQLGQVQGKGGGPPQVKFGLPNIIGNAEDMDNMQSADAQQISSIDPYENQADQVMAEDQDEFKDITPQLKRSKRNKSRPPG